jgi:sigma-B regulation protein RsbU (phosphoserine phosphatase)
MIAGRFATMCVVRLDRLRGTLTYANAGHNPPLVVRHDGRVERLTSGGTVLGVFPEATYAGGQTTLERGDRVLLFTDGITEALNSAEEEYGEERLTAALVRNRELGASALHAALWTDVSEFTGPRGFQDDATLLVVAVA